MKLPNSPGLTRYLANTSWLIVERVSRAFISLLISVYVARYLGPEKFGLLSYVTSFVGLFTVFATLSLDDILIRALLHTPNRCNELLGSAFVLRGLGTLFMFALLIPALYLTRIDSYSRLLILVISSAVLFQAFNVIDCYFQARVESKFVVKAQILQLLLSALLRLYLIFIQAPLVWFAWALVVDTMILAVGLGSIYSRRDLSLFDWRLSLPLTHQLLKDAWPLMLSGLAISIYMRIDQVMIKEMLDSTAVGHYAAAVRLSEAWYFVPMVISGSLFPAIIGAKQSDPLAYYTKLQKLYNLMVWLALSVAVPITLIGDWLILLLFGPSYAEATAVLKIQIWASVFVFLGIASGKWLVAEGLVKNAFYRTCLGAVINVVLNLLLIPSYGIQGAAFATLVAQAFAAFLYDATSPKTMLAFHMKCRSFLPLPVRILKS